MKTPLHLDTHVIAWLYAGRVDQFSARSRALLEERPLFISPAVELELGVLYDQGILRVPAGEIVQDLADRIQLTVSTASFSRVTNKALEFSWATDVFDRLICAEAELAEANLLTKDAGIHAHFSRAFW
ncbi:MAG: hypothetical protein B6A08_09125 [Sorangiineae bacterium NIC37A_2]|nr:MAG: hypothetical protein B6A08_09125 [Sorangiineae bacterium NIC37A_2]